MNPETGKFVPVVDPELYKALMQHRPPIEDQGPIPEDRPIFTIGEVFKLKGHPFKLARINRSTIVLRPIPQPTKSAATIIKELTHG